eukprot:Hpha_TRINITY_DN20509_c0_g1::TRINITY_DN20509_c0_g1_i1::g.30725::m.30725
MPGAGMQLLSIAARDSARAGSGRYLEYLIQAAASSPERTPFAAAAAPHTAEERADAVQLASGTPQTGWIAGSSSNSFHLIRGGTGGISEHGDSGGPSNTMTSSLSLRQTQPGMWGTESVTTSAQPSPRFDALTQASQSGDPCEDDSVARTARLLRMVEAKSAKLGSDYAKVIGEMGEQMKNLSGVQAAHLRVYDAAFGGYTSALGDAIGATRVLMGRVEMMDQRLNRMSEFRQDVARALEFARELDKAVRALEHDIGKEH